MFFYRMIAIVLTVTVIMLFIFIFKILYVLS